MIFSLLLILCATVFVNAYDEDGWHYEWCSTAGCTISFDLSVGGDIEVLATDYDAASEHIKVYVDGEYTGNCNPDQQARHDLWVPCTIPVGSIELRATDQVNYNAFSDASIGIVDAYVVVRIPTNLITGEMTLESLTETVAQMQQQIALLVQTNLQQAQEIQELTDNSVTRDSFTINNFRFDEYGTHRTMLGTTNTFCALSANRHAGSSNMDVGCKVYQQSSGIWSVWVYHDWVADEDPTKCEVYCLSW